MKSFKQEFNEYKLTVSGMSSLAEQSFIFWTNNFINKGISFNPNNFLKGKIYSFAYEDKLEGNKKFINRRPLVFFTGFTNKENKILFEGIDLILIPPPIRVSLLDRIKSVYKDPIEYNTKKIKESEGRGQIPLKTEFEILDTIFNGIPFKNSYRFWNTQKIKDVKEIYYEDWTKIVYLNTRSIEGTPIEEIYTKNMK